MTLHQLKIFAVVARHLSIGAAAAELHISQPSISQQLGLLAREIGTELHRKAGHGIELTPAGRLLLKEAKVIVSRMEKLRARLAGTLARGANEALTVGGSVSPSDSLLPSLLARFQKSHPQVQLNLRTNHRLAIERMILRGEVDIAVVNNPPLDRQLTMEPYRTEPLVAFVAPAHPLAKKSRLKWDDLGQVGFITRKELAGGGTVREYLQHLRKSGFQADVIMQCDTPAAVKEAVRGKMGVGILYKEAAADNIARGEFKALNLPGKTFGGRSYIIYHKKRPLSPCAREFLKLLNAKPRKK